MNVSATFNVLRLLVQPQLCLPHFSVSSFDKLPLPLQFKPNQITNSRHFQQSVEFKRIEIKAVVLDKDNCFAANHADHVYPEYKSAFSELKRQFPQAQLLIVSNSAGTNDDEDYKQALKIEKETGVKVLRHSTKKPGCHTEIMKYFRENNITHRASEVAIVGDRLFTDVLMANMMGAWSVWVYDGVKRSESLICKIERSVASYLTHRGTTPPLPKS